MNSAYIYDSISYAEAVGLRREYNNCYRRWINYITSYKPSHYIAYFGYREFEIYKETTLIHFILGNVL